MMATKGKKLIIFIFLIFLNSSACTTELSNETVMQEGMIIQATNDNGTITIKAVSALERIYKWGEVERKIKLIPRKKRWYGSLGIYNSKVYRSGRFFLINVEEGQQHFCSEKEALDWLRWKDENMHYVYTSDGLVVGWYTETDANSPRGILGVEVWQFYIKGRKPNNLSGAHNDRIAVSCEKCSPTKQVLPGNFVPSEPKTINGRLYSGKALDYMKEWGIAPDNVEKTIRSGKPIQKGAYYMYIDYMDTSNMLWVMTDKNGDVILTGK